MQEVRAMTLIEHLTLVEETRSEINRKHNLVDVMFLVISAIMSGAEGWNDIETYGDSKIDWLRQHRPLPTASAASHGCPHSALHCHRYLARSVAVLGQ